MNYTKLNEATEAYMKKVEPTSEFEDLTGIKTESKISNANSRDYDILEIGDAFSNGAEWLMSLPLSERLTDKERQIIRCLYNIADRELIEVIKPSVIETLGSLLKGE